MNIKNVVLLALSLGAGYQTSWAQSVDDAFTFSRDDNSGSARFKALGNAQTALGGDISSINGNPAGLGFFSRSDASITFDYMHNSNGTSFLGSNSTSKKGHFGISQAGVVLALPTINQIKNYRGWQSFGFGISYNRKQNFNNTLQYSGVNNESSYVNSLTDLMEDDATFRSDFKNSNLVELFANPEKGYFPLAVEKDNKDQYNDLFTKGAHSNIAISLGANYNNNLYIGASIRTSFFQYDKTKVFEEYGWTKRANEVAQDNPDSPFADPNSNTYKRFGDKNYELYDEYWQNTEGKGIDFKLGLIYKPTTDINLGLTVTTPTWLTINESTEAFTDVDFYEDATSSTPLSSYESNLYSSQSEYYMNTPWKFSVGATKFHSRGLLTAEIEYVAYNTTTYSVKYGADVYGEINNGIKESLKGTWNLRLGGEYLFNNILSGRAGFNYFGNAFKGSEETNLNASLGLGIKLSNSAYLDFAVVHNYNSYSVAPYTLSNFWIDRGIYEPIANLKHNKTNALITIGTKF